MVKKSLPKKRSKRLCLGVGCGRMFNSTGPGNRICGKCMGKREKWNHRDYRHQSKTPAQLVGIRGAEVVTSGEEQGRWHG